MAFLDRYRAVGYDHNPFATDSLAASEVFIDCGLAPPSPHSRTLCQLIGDRGLGKTAHLRQWRRSQPGPHHYIPLSPYSSRWQRPPMDAHDIGSGTVYGDEIDRMPSMLRSRWFRCLASANATVIVGTHVDLGPAAERAGFTVERHQLAPLTLAQVRCLIETQLERVRIDTPLVGFNSGDLDTVYAQSAGVPREVEVLCHQVFANKVALAASGERQRLRTS